FRASEPSRTSELLDGCVAHEQALGPLRPEVDDRDGLVAGPRDLDDGAQAERIVRDAIARLHGDDLALRTDPVGESGAGTGRRRPTAGTPAAAAAERGPAPGRAATRAVGGAVRPRPAAEAAATTAAQ